MVQFAIVILLGIGEAHHSECRECRDHSGTSTSPVPTLLSLGKVQALNPKPSGCDHCRALLLVCGR